MGQMIIADQAQALLGGRGKGAKGAWSGWGAVPPNCLVCHDDDDGDGNGDGDDMMMMMNDGDCVVHA